MGILDPVGLPKALADLLYDPLTPTAPMPQTLDPATVEYVSVSGSNQIGWMSFDGLRIYNRRDDIIRKSADGTSYTSLTDGPWRNRRQVVTLGGTGLTSFTLTLSGQTTTSLSATATAAQVQAALEALSNVGTGNVVVGGAAGGPYYVKFSAVVSTATAVAQMTSTPTGGTGTVNVSRRGIQTTFVRETGDGELLACMDSSETAPSGAATDVRSEVWKSTGYASGTNLSPSWTLVLTLQDSGCWVDHRFGHWVDGSDVFLVEYGIKSTSCAPKKGYHSSDNGATWRTIFTHPSASLAEAHIHGIAYDKYWDAVWITTGDSSANRGTYLSTDWRNTTPTWTNVSTGTPQLVRIYPMRDRILFLSDDKPDGVYSMTRGANKTPGALTLAHAVGADGSLFRYLGGTMYRRGDGYPLIIAWAPSASPAVPSILTLSMDGINFYDVWTDPQGNYTGGYSQGLFSAFGPTASGKIVGGLRDDRYPYTTFRAPMPTFRKLPRTFTPAGTEVKIVTDSSGVIGVQFPDGSIVYPTATPTIADGSITDAKLATEINNPMPADQGLIAWSMDVGVAGSQTILDTAGTAHGVRLYLHKPHTITNIIMHVGVAGSGLTSGQCFAALYQGGSLLAQTADQAAAWASTGTKTMALSAPQAVAVGYVDVLFWANGTTLPQFVRGNTLTSLANVGATTARFYKANSGLTTTAPASIGARTNSTAYLVALS